MVTRHRHLATAVCAWRGHVTPAATASPLDGPLLLGLDVDLADPATSGATQASPPLPSRLARCMRCDSWQRVARPGPGTGHPLPDPQDLAVPRRDEALRSAIVMRLISVERGIHCVIFTLVAALAVVLRIEIVGVKGWVRHLLAQLTTHSTGTGDAFGGSFLVREGNHLLTLKTSTLNIVIAAAVAYAVVEGVEAVGLWRERRWAEYLTVVATVGFIPYEVSEMVKGVSALKVGALVLNLAVLAYLLWSKELFGIGRLRDRRRPKHTDPLEPFIRPRTADQGHEGHPQPVR